MPRDLQSLFGIALNSITHLADPTNHIRPRRHSYVIFRQRSEGYSYLEWYSADQQQNGSFTVQRVLNFKNKPDNSNDVVLWRPKAITPEAITALREFIPSDDWGRDLGLVGASHIDGLTSIEADQALVGWHLRIAHTLDKSNWLVRGNPRHFSSLVETVPTLNRHNDFHPRRFPKAA